MSLAACTARATADPAIGTAVSSTVTVIANSTRLPCWVNGALAVLSPSPSVFQALLAAGTGPPAA
jgi:hypothetical protein